MYKKLSKKEIRNIMMNISPKYNKKHDITEEFKQIKFDDGYTPYIISSFGRVFSINYMHQTGNVKQLKTQVDKDGYELLIINYNQKSYGYHIHRLVAMHFIKNKNKKKSIQVNHKNGKKLHNYIWNLEWTTPKENIQHAWKHKLSKSIGEGNGKNKYKEKDIIRVCELLEKDICFNDISKITGVSVPMISCVYTGKNWKHVSKKYDFSSYTYGRHKI